MSNRNPSISIRNFNIPVHKIEKYKDVFNILDKDNKGKILSKDLIKINAIFNYPINEKKINEKIKRILSKEELFFEEFVFFMEKQNQIIKEYIDSNIIKSNGYLGNKRKREIPIIQIKEEYNKEIREEKEEYNKGIKREKEEIIENIKIKKENFIEIEMSCNCKKNFSIKNNNSGKKPFMIEIEKKKINFKKIKEELKYEKMNENQKNSKKNNSNINLEIKNNNIIILKKCFLLEQPNSIGKNRKNIDCLTPVKTQKRNKIFYFECFSPKYTYNNGFYSPQHWPTGINSRFGKSPTISITKKSKNLINHSCEEFLVEIKKRLLEKKIKQNNNKKNNNKNNEQTLNTIFNNNSYDSKIMNENNINKN